MRTTARRLARSLRTSLPILTAMAALIALVFGSAWFALDRYLRPGAFDRRKEAVQTPSAVVGGAVLLLGPFFTRRTLQITREGQVTDRFT